jgi:MFS family permease
MASARSRNALSGLNFLIGAVQTGFGPFVSVWLTEQGWLQADVGLALSVGTIAGLLGQLPAGFIADAAGLRTAFLALTAAGAAAVLLVWIAMPETRPTS